MSATSNATVAAAQPPPSPNFVIEYKNPVDPSTATAIYFFCGLIIFCIIVSIVYKEYLSRRHNDRQRTLAYLAPYLPRNGDGRLVIYEDMDVEGGGDRQGRDNGVTLVNEEEAPRRGSKSRQ